MTDAANRTVITMELDDSDLRADIPRADAIFMDFVDRMQRAAKITPTVDVDALGRVKISVPVDPKTTTAGMEVIQNIVKEYSARMRKEAKINVGVDTQQVPKAFAFIRNAANKTFLGLGAAFAFTFSRGIENLIQAAVKSPFDLIRNSLGAFRESEEASKSLTKAINATGGQAKKSREELEAYGKQLEKLTNISDEAVAAVQVKLLSSEGLTGDNFDRATRGALDLAEALGGDAASRAEQLSKALQDPVRGMKMLRDAGISFSTSQKDMIKLFVETGDLASAQGIILDELESRYGGTANATGNFTDKMKELGLAYDNFLEDMGQAIAQTDTAFIPSMEKGVQVLQDLTPMLVGTASALSELAAQFLDVAVKGEGIGDLSLDEKANKISEWASAIKANFGSVAGAAALLNIKLTQALTFKNTLNDRQLPSNLGLIGLLYSVAGGFEDSSKESIELLEKLSANYEQAAIDARASKQEQDRLDLEAAQDKYKQDQEIRDLALARGSGLVSEADIKEKGAKQALIDAKRAIAEKKAAAKAIKDAELAQEKEDRETKRVIRERIAKQNKEAADATRARSKAEAEEASRLAKELRDRKKADAAADKQADREVGNDSLEGMHKRIQDALLNRQGGSTTNTVAEVPWKDNPNNIHNWAPGGVLKDTRTASERRRAFREEKAKERSDKWDSVFGEIPVDEDIVQGNIDNMNNLDAFRPKKRTPQFAAEDPRDPRVRGASDRGDNRAFTDPGRLADVVKAIKESAKDIVKSNEEPDKMGP